jgi:putative ABC transport system substrate-binding protein
MNKILRIRFFNPQFDNLRSKTCAELRRNIQYLKWAGFLAIIVSLVGRMGMAEAQQPGKIPRIGILEYRGPSDRARIWEAFRQGLRELGYIEGKNIIMEFRYAEGNIQRLPELAAELVRLKVDIIVTSDARPAIASRKITTTTSIVMAGGRDPVEAGLAASLAHPGGNVTGVTNLSTELLGKRLELLKEAVPRISRVAVLNEASGGGQRTAVVTKEMVGPARGLGIQLKALEVRAPELDFDQAFRRAVGAHRRARYWSDPHFRFGSTYEADSGTVD